MSTQTTHYGLYKPESTDKPRYFRQPYNTNMDTIDGALYYSICSIAPEWAPGFGNFAINSYAYHENILYVRVGNNNDLEWDPSDWSQVTLCPDLIKSLIKDIATEWLPFTIYNPGQYTMHNGVLYVRTRPPTQEAEWNSNAWDAVSLTSLITAIDTKVNKYEPSEYTGDLDSLGNGIYYCPSTATNIPTANDYMVHSMVWDSNSKYVVQVAYQQSTLNNIWVRRRHGGSWTAWMKAIMDSAADYSDLNDYTSPGFYKIKSTALNLPVDSTDGTMITTAKDDSNIVNQIAFVGGKVFRRSSVSSTWDSWEELVSARTFLEAGISIPQNSDLNNYTAKGVYSVANAATAATVSNIPTTSVGGRLEVLSSANNTGYTRQVYYSSAASNQIFTRTAGTTNNWGTTSQWMRFDLYQTYTLSDTTPKTFTIGNNSRILIDFITSAAARCGQLAVYASSSGTMYVNKVTGLSDLTVSTATNSLTLSNLSGTAYCHVYNGYMAEATSS